MPEITQADIAAVQRLKEHQGKCPDEATVTTMLQVAFAQHRTAAAEAARGESTRAERERIVEMCNKSSAKIHNEIDSERCTIAYEELLQERLVGICLIRDAIELGSPLPPPTPLTADAVKRIEISGIMLRRSGDHVILEAEIEGRWVELIDELHDSNFSHIVEAAGMRLAFAKLIEALGVTAEVGK